MVRLVGMPPLCLVSLFAISVSSVSAVIISVVISQEVEVWREGLDEALRRKDTEPFEFRLCRPPNDKPWLGVFAIDPEVTSCEAVERSSPSWDFRQIEYEPRSAFIPVPGSVSLLQGPTGIPVTNTNEPEDFFTYGEPNVRQTFYPSKWLVERFGNTGTFERLSKENPVRAGDSLRYWDENLIGYGQLYLRQVKGNPQRLTRARPPVDQDNEEDFSDAVARIRREFPYAELRIASLGDTEIVGPGVPTRTQKIINKIGNSGKSFFSFLKGGRGKSQLEMNRVRSPSDELDDEDFRIIWNPEDVVQNQRVVTNNVPAQLDRWVMDNFEEYKEVKFGSEPV
ncbi:hypothetical protein TWF696_008724 [Orbilia brochopaga]|uniref:Uncharacterized protein n=1 Tax=Orbilia brochopaga TaxID=3140254 RepID=A0AAV9UL96_9PEZI